MISVQVLQNVQVNVSVDILNVLKCLVHKLTVFMVHGDIKDSNNKIWKNGEQEILSRPLF